MAKRKILIIDDDPIWHGLFKRIFGGIKYDVQVAGSCAEGVKMAERLNPDCILLDFHLQDGNAVSVCSELRKNGKRFDTPVLVISSDPCAEIAAYEKCRAAYFVLKGSRSIVGLPGIVEKVLHNGEAARPGPPECSRPFMVRRKDPPPNY